MAEGARCNDGDEEEDEDEDEDEKKLAAAPPPLLWSCQMLTTARRPPRKPSGGSGGVGRLRADSTARPISSSSSCPFFAWLLLVVLGFLAALPVFLRSPLLDDSTACSAAAVKAEAPAFCLPPPPP